MTVKLSRRDADDARRLLELLSAGDGLLLTGEAAKDNGEDMAVSMRRMARSILSSRRRRHDLFGKSIFGEPAWEMLLLLYVLDTGQRQTIRSLADIAELSKSTAIRWIDYLVGRNLVHREPHPTDKRAAYVALTDKATSLIETYLIDTVTMLD